MPTPPDLPEEPAEHIKSILTLQLPQVDVEVDFIGGTNPMADEAWKDSVLSMDPPRHRTIRKVFDDALRPKFIRKVAGDLDAQAGALVDELLERGEFDGVKDFAHKLPVNVVMDLVGFPRDEGRDKILGWAEGSFNFAGPLGDRQTASLPGAQAQLEYLIEHATREPAAGQLRSGRLRRRRPRGDHP